MSDPRKDYLKAQPVVQEIVAEAVRKEREACDRAVEGCQDKTYTFSWNAALDEALVAIRARGERLGRDMTDSTDAPG